jgi:hypothetical protein
MLIGTAAAVAMAGLDKVRVDAPLLIAVIRVPGVIPEPMRTIPTASPRVFDKLVTVPLVFVKSPVSVLRETVPEAVAFADNVRVLAGPFTALMVVLAGIPVTALIAVPTWRFWAVLTEEMMLFPVVVSPRK